MLSSRLSPTEPGVTVSLDARCWKSRSFAVLLSCARARSARGARPAKRRARRRLGGADPREEVINLGAQGVGLASELARSGKDLRGGGAGLVRRLIDARNVARDLLGATRGLLGAARDLAGGGALLLDRRGDRGRDFADLADRAVDPLDRLDGAFGRGLNGGDL